MHGDYFKYNYNYVQVCMCVQDSVCNYTIYSPLSLSADWLILDNWISSAKFGKNSYFNNTWMKLPSESNNLNGRMVSYWSYFFIDTHQISVSYVMHLFIFESVYMYRWIHRFLVVPTVIIMPYPYLFANILISAIYARWKRK